MSGDAGHGGITVSFPDLDRANSSGSSSSYDSVDGSVSTKRYTNGASKVSYFPSGYSPIHNEDGSTGTAGHLIVESDDTDWPARDYRILELNVTPKQSRSFRIYYRFWLCGDQYDDCTRRPHSSESDQVDQQGWHVGVYTVDVANQASGPFARNSAEDFDTLDAADNESPTGIWSDETTMWVADWSDEKIYAYSMSNKGRVSSKDFDTLDDAGNDNPEGIWSDGTTMWVADSSDDKIYAYNMSNKARVSSKDFDTLDAAGNDSPEGIWSDGTTMWVADSSDAKIYAYNMSNKGRVSSKDFDTLESAENERPTGIWSDGTTMWVADSSDDKIYAYNMSNKGRVASKDFDTLDAASNGSPTGIWSDRETVWVADSSDDKIYAYNAPEMAPVTSTHGPSVSRVTPASASVSLYTGNTQTFTARASDPDNDLKRYEWFVNNQSEDSGVWRIFLPTGSVDKSFSHTFATAGSHTVTATFTDDDGSSASVSWTVQVTDNRAPEVSRVSPTLEEVSLETGGVQTFTARATDADNNLSKWQWVASRHISFLPDEKHTEPEASFALTGDISKTFSYTFGTAGTWTVTATFTDSEGESGSAAWTVEVGDQNSPPTVTRVPASPSSLSLYTGNTQTFTARASDPDNDLKRYEWFVNNQSEDSGVWRIFLPTGSEDKSFSHTFATAGSHTVTATFTDDDGSSASVSWTVQVTDNRAPEVSRVSPTLEEVSLETGGVQTFTARATDADNNLSKWQWVASRHISLLPDEKHTEPEASFTLTGDISKTFSHTFGTAGTWTVTATFTDSEGESGSAAWTVEVGDQNSPPTVTRVPASPSSLSLHTGGVQTFTARATDADNNLSKWQWVASRHISLLPDEKHTEPEASFALIGDISKTFSYTFGTAGTWTVTATFTDSEGESGSAAWTVEVSDPHVTVTVNSDPAGLTVAVDGADQTTPYTADWTSGSAHTLNAPSPQTVGQNVYVFSSWSDGLAQNHSVSPTTDTSYTANFTLTTAVGDGRAEITSCGSDPASPTVKDEWAPVATVTNHRYSGRLSKKFYVEFTISDPTRGLYLPGTKSTTQTWIEVGESGTFVGPAASWPKELKEKPTEREVIEDTRQLSLLKLKWFPGEIVVKCELKANDIIWGDEELDTDDTGRVTISPLQGGSAATITALNEATTCAPARRPVLSGEVPTLQAKTRPIPENSDGVTRLAVEYWVYRDGQRVHHDGYGWAWSRSGEKTASVNWENDQPLPLGQYRLDCALWGHRVSPAYEPLGFSSRSFEVFLKWLEKILDWRSDPAGVIKRLKEAGKLPTTSNVQILEREYISFDYALQGLVSTEFSVVEARWGAEGLSIESRTETLPDAGGGEPIRVRVNREETKDRIGGRIAAPYFLIEGPKLRQIEQATLCQDGNQDHTTYSVALLGKHV